MSGKSAVNPIPLGYTPTRILSKDGKTSRAGYRCGEITEGIDLTFRRCTCVFRRERIDTNHEHRFNLSFEEDEEFQEQSLFDNINLTSIRQRIARRIAKFAAEMNISASASASELMELFVLEILAIGINSGRQSNHISPKQLYSRYSDKTMQRYMLQESLNDEKVLINKYIDEKYAAIVVDGGTVANLHSFLSIIASPALKIQPLLVKLYEIGIVQDTEAYQGFFLDLLDRLHEKEISIASITLDHLAVQNSAIKNIIEKAQSPEIKAIKVVGCFCHCINLVFTYSKSQCGVLDNLISDIREVRNFLSCTECKLQVKSRPPGFPDTRWLYIVDLLQYFYNKHSQINDYILANRADAPQCVKEGLPIRFTWAGELFGPLKMITLTLESRDSSLADVVPVVTTAYEDLKQLYQKYKDDEEFIIVYKHIVANFIARIRSNSYDEAITAFALSLKGRSQIILNINRSNPLAVLSSQVISRRSAYTIIDEIEETNYFEETSASGTVLTESTDLLEEPIVRDEANDTFLHILPMLMDKNIEELLEINLFDDFANISLREIKKMGSLFGFEDDFENLLSEWFLPRGFTLDPMRNTSNASDYNTNASSYLFWKRCLSNSRLNHLAQIAIRFNTMLPSEAEAERFISIMRDICGTKITNICTDTMEARIKYRTMNLHD